MSKVPGSKQQHQIKAALPKLSPQMRTALCVACAERVRPVLEDFFGKPRKECRAAIDLAWRFALGETLQKAAVQKVINQCDALAEKLYDRDQDGATLYALNAISYTLRTTLNGDLEAADNAISNASDAASTDDPRKGDVHIEEEATWQLQALKVAIKARTVTRNMFESLPAPPNWLTNFYDFRAENKPIP